MSSVEFVIPLPRHGKPSGNFLHALKAAAERAGARVFETPAYQSKGDLVVIYGVGSPEGAAARKRHLETAGRHALLFDLGYFGRKKWGGYYRTSIDDDHAQRWIDATPLEPGRFAKFNITLREDANPAGHIVLVGLGRKARRYLKAPHWEAEKLAALRARFPRNKIVYRPKPGWPALALGCKVADGPLESVLRGASLVVCRHSNVAIDAAIAGVPFEAEDGAAMALRDWTPAGRMEFLQRLAWWQWHETEADAAWRFLMERLECA